MKILASPSLVLAAAVLLCACANPPRFQSAQPRTSAPAGYTLAQSPLVSETNYMTQHLDQDRSVVYFQNYGGGGLGLGVLLGPFGLAASMSTIENVTKKDVLQLKDKLDVRPKELFAEAARQKGVDVSSDPAAFRPRITPYLHVSKTEGDALLVSSALLAEQGAGSTQWSGRYMYQLPLKYTVSELGHLDAQGAQVLRAAAFDGFARLIAHVDGERPERVGQEKRIVFRSDLVSPRFDYELLGMLISDDSDVVWVRTAGGVYGVRRSNIRFSLQKS